MCPPVAMTPGLLCTLPMRSCSAWQAGGRSSRSATVWPLSTASSSRLGVIQSTNGSSCSRSMASPARSISSLPDEDRRTGSNTTTSRLLPSCSWRSCSRYSQIILMLVASDTIPILTPAGGRSDRRQSRVSLTIVAAVGYTNRTPTVDWTVNPVMHAVPKRPCAAKTIRSAVTPAPDDGSNPAMVRTVCIASRAKKGKKLVFFEKSRFSAGHAQFRGHRICLGRKVQLWWNFRSSRPSFFYTTKLPVPASREQR